MKIHHIDQDTVRETLKSLPPRFQQAIYLRFYKSFFIEEVASSMEISWKEANKLIDQGVLMMKKILLQNLEKKAA